MISSAFKQFLEQERHYCNALFASVHQQYEHVDIDSFNQFLLEVLDPCISQLANTNRAYAEFARAGYQHGLELASRRWLGASEYYPYVKRLWSDVVCSSIAIVNMDPAFWLASLTNALSQVYQQAEQMANQWLDVMARLSPLCQTLDELQRVSVLSAWLSGLACYREAALQALTDLRPEIFISAFLLPENADCIAIEQQLKASAWFFPHLGQPQALSIQRRVGSALFFDGEFSEPPTLIQNELLVYVKSGESLWLMYVDFFGQMLIPVNEHSLVISSLEDGSDGWKKITEPYGKLGLKGFLSDISSISSAVESRDSLLLTSPETFSVMVFNR